MSINMCILSFAVFKNVDVRVVIYVFVVFGATVA